MTRRRCTECGKPCDRRYADTCRVCKHSNRCKCGGLKYRTAKMCLKCRREERRIRRRKVLKKEKDKKGRMVK